MAKQKFTFREMPVLSLWVGGKFQELEEIPEREERKGVPKGDPYPMSRIKLQFCLLKAVAPSFQLKLNRIAESLSVPYSTVREWNIHERVEAQAWAFAMEFQPAFIGSIDDSLNRIDFEAIRAMPPLLFDPYEMLYTAISSLYTEVQHYRGMILSSIVEPLNVFVEKGAYVKGFTHEHILGVIAVRLLDGIQHARLMEFEAKSPSPTDDEWLEFVEATNRGMATLIRKLKRKE